MKRIYLPLVISLVLILSLLGLTGCPFSPGNSQTHSLSVNVSPAGAGSVSPSGGTYDEGTSVTLTATPASGYAFDYWSGSASGTSPNTTVLMDGDKTVTANFVATGTTGTTGTTDTTGTGALFSDDFSQDTGNWDVFSDSNGQVFYEGGWLHVLNYTTAPVSTGTMAYQYFDDFSLTVDTKLVDGTEDNWQIVICRWQDANNYLAFAISADGYYNIFKCVNGEETSLASYYSTNINQGVGAVNNVNIVCISSNLSLYVNGSLMETVIDSTFYGGYIGFVTTSLGGSFSEVAFDNLVVTEQQRS